jgi:hypothetical protein
LSCPSHSSWLMKSTRSEAPHYVILSSLLLFHPSWVQIPSSAPCSQRAPVSIRLLTSETKFSTHEKQQTLKLRVLNSVWYFKRKCMSKNLVSNNSFVLKLQTCRGYEILELSSTTSNQL